MKLISILLFIICQFGIIYLTKAIKLLSSAWSYSNYDFLFSPLIKKFNEYAKENSIDTEIDIELHSPSNSSLYVDDYGSFIEHLLKKKSTKYDIIFYDVIYTPRYSSYFIDLKDYLPKEHIDNYASGIAYDTCVHNGKWVGLHVSIDHTFLYSNKYYLNKYNRTVPKTWDELLDTGKYILEKEREEGNTDLIGYNGQFPNYETAISSAQEVIYSFRKTVNSSYPDYDTLFLFTIMLISSLFLFINCYKKWFYFFSKKYWLIIFLGFNINLGSIFTKYGELTNLKCYLGNVFYIIGFTLIYIPILYKLIVNFQLKNKFVTIIENSQKLFIPFFLIIDVIFIMGLYFSSYSQIETIFIDQGKNYKACRISNVIGIITFFTMISEKLFILLFIFILIFLEWNIKKTFIDMKLITSAIYIDILLIIVASIVYYMKFTNYIVKFTLSASLNLFYVFSNFFFIYGFRIPLIYSKKREDILKLLNDIPPSSTTDSKSIYSSTTNKSRMSTFTLKILNCHYYQGDVYDDNDDIPGPLNISAQKEMSNNNALSIQIDTSNQKIDASNQKIDSSIQKFDVSSNRLSNK
ncbi:hypothetical protein BCR32DRAFT_268953 [Anaeromyces robustus]|uniref:G-protein coupled receptors family 3 profile domain-containing protein n=1 Tax=Anaeromyces robustus TaxID=1754192 RepID=A0A1Y1X4I1_9FUNG|nr:hypothetical protein BCR32DRAFT_268953 [Anaeromyces robustus]|eukprot:ORX80266.1 hypothetical protein BCR32DRAFT_268953 [Anaeromyces robustus]